MPISQVNDLTNLNIQIYSLPQHHFLPFQESICCKDQVNHDVTIKYQIKIHGVHCTQNQSVCRKCIMEKAAVCLPANPCVIQKIQIINAQCQENDC